MSGEKTSDVMGNPTHEKLIQAAKECFNSHVGSGILLDNKPAPRMSAEAEKACAAEKIQAAGVKMGGVNNELLAPLAELAVERHTKGRGK